MQLLIRTHDIREYWRTINAKLVRSRYWITINAKVVRSRDGSDRLFIYLGLGSRLSVKSARDRERDDNYKAGWERDGMWGYFADFTRDGTGREHFSQMPQGKNMTGRNRVTYRIHFPGMSRTGNSSMGYNRLDADVSHSGIMSSGLQRQRNLF